MCRWVRGYVGTRLLKLFWPGRMNLRYVGGYVGTWVHGFRNFSGRGDVPMSWICGYRDTRVSKLFWPGGSLHMIAGAWYTAFKLFWPGAVDGSG